MTSAPKKGLFSWYFRTNLLWRILIGLILGVLAGMLFKDKILWVDPLGKVFVRLLQMIVMPLIISTLVVGAANVSPVRLGRAGVKIVVFYLVTSGLAVAIGLALANLFKPGLGLHLQSSAEAAGKELNAPSLMDTFLNIIPTNIFKSIAAGDVLPVIFFSILFGIGVSYLRASHEEPLAKAGEVLFSVFNAIAEVMFKVVRWIMEYAPIGVFALLAVVFAKESANIVGSLTTVISATYIGFVLHLVFIYGAFLLINRLSLRTFVQKARPAMLTSFVTRSSSGTLPLTMMCCDKMGMSREISSFTLPLGATINMDGTAIYQGVCAMFIAYAIGYDLSLAQQLTIIITAVLASVGTAGVPGAGAIMLLIVLKSVGLDIEEGSAVAAAYAMILGIDSILDMGRTSLNVTGDMAGTALVSKSEGLLDKAQYDRITS
ncbi:dicarboxylate/amino acid:cation symporter [Brackiella oedipodis]|uniref:dicarboxylate/amino acid:cation symporter n=1 Tax=Brackiella oedipodis TaxID=124225 RepID=UPI000491CBF5|nr:dicarboxylate/amino acid:cation symporter [Brackiella oedipodis]